MITCFNCLIWSCSKKCHSTNKIILRDTCVTLQTKIIRGKNNNVLNFISPSKIQISGNRTDFKTEIQKHISYKKAKRKHRVPGLRFNRLICWLKYCNTSTTNISNRCQLFGISNLLYYNCWNGAFTRAESRLYAGLRLLPEVHGLGRGMRTPFEWSISCKEQSRKSSLCSYLGRKDWKNTH